MPHTTQLGVLLKQDDVAKSYDFLHKNKFFETTGKVSKAKMGALLAALKGLGDIEGATNVERFVLPNVGWDPLAAGGPAWKAWLVRGVLAVPGAALGWFLARPINRVRAASPRRRAKHLHR